MLLVATAVATFASDLPLVELIDPRSLSKDVQGAVLTTKDGRKVSVHLRTFGYEKIETARAFGKAIALNTDRDQILRKKSVELYPGDIFFQQAFLQFANQR